MKTIFSIVILFLISSCLTTNPPTGGSVASTVTAGSANTINYTWTTSNTGTYMCSTKGVSVTSGVVNANVACGQSDYPTNTVMNVNTNGVIYCPTGTTIQCILYATYGRAGGSCAGDPFSDDPSGAWAYLPEAVATKMIGQNTFTLDTTTDMTINTVPVTSTVVSSSPAKKLKILVNCSSGTTTGTTSSNFIKMGIAVAAFLIMILV